MSSKPRGARRGTGTALTFPVPGPHLSPAPFPARLGAASSGAVGAWGAEPEGCGNLSCPGVHLLPGFDSSWPAQITAPAAAGVTAQDHSKQHLSSGLFPKRCRVQLPLVLPTRVSHQGSRGTARSNSLPSSHLSSSIISACRSFPHTFWAATTCSCSLAAWLSPRRDVRGESEMLPRCQGCCSGAQMKQRISDDLWGVSSGEAQTMAERSCS